MLVYSPHMDVYHSALRILSLVRSDSDGVDLDRCRLVSFYMALPNALESMRVPKSLISLKARLKKNRNRYNSISNQRSLFLQTVRVGDISINMLIAKSLLDRSAFDEGVVRASQDNINNIAGVLDEYVRVNSELFDTIVPALNGLPLHGPDGLKARSGLMEFRYDVV